MFLSLLSMHEIIFLNDSNLLFHFNRAIVYILAASVTPVAAVLIHFNCFVFVGQFAFVLSLVCLIGVCFLVLDPLIDDWFLPRSDPMCILHDLDLNQLLRSKINLACMAFLSPFSCLNISQRFISLNESLIERINAVVAFTA